MSHRSRSKRESRSDPIDILREFLMNKKSIKLKDNYLYFDQQKFKLTTETAWIGNQSKKQFNLGSLWLFLDHKENKTGFAAYIQQQQKLGLDMVNAVEGKDIIDYFKGTTEFSECINLELKNSLMMRKTKKDKPAGEGDDIKKKIKTDDSRPDQDNHEESQKEKPEMSFKDECLKIMDWISKTEKPINSKTRMIRSNNKSFKYLLHHLTDMSRNVPIQKSSTGSSSITHPCILKDILSEHKRPLIIVPQSNNSGSISLKNASQLLENGLYEDPEKCQTTVNPERIIEIKREIGGHKDIVFEVVDNVENINRKNEWNRVVAVFCSGKDIQFKVWPSAGQGLASLFSKYRGFFLHYHDFPLSNFVRGLNVKVFDVHRYKRQQDIQIMHQFWSELETFVLRPKDQK